MVYCAAVVYHKKAYQSLIDTLLTEPVIVPQVDHVLDDNGNFNIGESMLVASNFVVKKKESKRGGGKND
eukprot:3650504-Ditylum_brightwellii.AAC.1